MSNPIFLREKFDDFDQFNEAAKNWLLNFKQLDSGKFRGELMLLDIEDLLFMSAEFNRKFDQEASTPQGYRTFGIPANDKQSFTWRGYDIDSSKILIVPKSGEMEAISNPGFKVYTVSIAEKWIEVYRESQGANSLQVLENGTEVLDMNKQAMNLLRQQLQYLINQVVNHPGILQEKAFQQIFKNEVPSLLLKNLAFHDSLSFLPSKRIRDISLSKAIGYLRECKKDFPSVKELCLISGASQRTLEYAFKEKYGIGPKGYMKIQKLNLVNKALKKADPLKTNVLEIAQRYGFWHMGQFGSDYKKLFAELPSSTLKKLI